MTDQPHRRYNQLTGEWLLVSPQRAKRPWQGQTEITADESRPKYDPDCYLCPGNSRINGDKNADYADVYSFNNDHAALLDTEQKQAVMPSPSSLLRSQAANGACRVICFSPRHDLTLAEMSLPAIEKVIAKWQQQVEELGQRYQWVQLFENKGAVMGCSNPHPHGQVWASDFIPTEISKEIQQQQQYFKQQKQALLLDYADLEQQQQQRIVTENDDWLVVVPYWAAWPYETLLLPKKHRPSLLNITAAEIKNLAAILKTLLMAYDKLFNVSFPYSMGWHGATKSSDEYHYWQLHAHFYPPLLRSATIKKFMVGYELLAETQRDITAEQATHYLREVIKKHEL